MIKQLSNWKLLRKSIEQEIPCVLLYVVKSAGSSPGRQGFSMVVNANEEMSGSLGGGMMEHKMVELAKHQLREKVESKLIPQFHNKTATSNQSGMICSGEQFILLQPITEDDLPIIQNIIHDLERGKSGKLFISNSGINYSSEIPVAYYAFKIGGDLYEYTEKTGFKNFLHIIGGGHCALAFSKLMKELDFHVTVYEDRPELHTLQMNEYAHKISLVNTYSEIEKLIPEGNEHYVVIMTFGYRTDDIAIRAILHKQFKYIGVMGSKNKMKTLLETYRTEGIDETNIQQLHTPIGISINSQTPEEIAVSIAAEIISIKNRKEIN